MNVHIYLAGYVGVLKVYSAPPAGSGRSRGNSWCSCWLKRVMTPQGGGEGEGGVTTLGGEGEGGLPLHLPAAEEVGHRALQQVAGDGHHASLDILAWYFCLKQALVFSICWRGVDVARYTIFGEQAWVD